MISFEEKGKDILYFLREIWPRCASAILAMISVDLYGAYIQQKHRIFSHKQLWLWISSPFKN